MQPLGASSPFDPTNVHPTWKSLFTSLPGDPSTTLSLQVDSDFPPSGESSLGMDEKLVMPSMLISVSQVETLLSEVLCRVTIRRSINEISDLSSDVDTCALECRYFPLRNHCQNRWNLPEQPTRSSVAACPWWEFLIPRWTPPVGARHAPSDWTGQLIYNSIRDRASHFSYFLIWPPAYAQLPSLGVVLIVH